MEFVNNYFPKEKSIVCCFCNKKKHEYGNNQFPLKHKRTCCNECNIVVILARNQYNTS